MNVLPSPTLGLHMRPIEFVVSVKYRLGVPVVSEAGQCPACNYHSDVLGDHAERRGARISDIFTKSFMSSLPGAMQL